MEFLEHPHGGGDQHFAGALGATRADHFVISFGVGGAVRDVPDRPVGQLGDLGLRERRHRLDVQAQLDKNFARQRDPREVLPQRDDLHFHFPRLARATRDIEHFEGLDQLHEIRRLHTLQHRLRFGDVVVGDRWERERHQLAAHAERRVGDRFEVHISFEHRRGEDGAQPVCFVGALLARGPVDVQMIEVAARAVGEQRDHVRSLVSRQRA